MPFLTLDPSQAESLNAAVQENNLDPPASPTEPTPNTNPEPATTPGPPRTLGKDSVFTPFVAKDPKDEGDVLLVDAVNKHLTDGGKLSDLDSDILSGLHQATQGGDGALENRDVLNDSEQFYQLKFRNGKYEPQPSIIDTLVGLHEDPLKNYPKLAEGFINNAVNFIRSIGVGSYQIATTPAPEQPAVISTGWEAVKQFYKSLNPFAEVPGGMIAGVPIAMGLQLAQTLPDSRISKPAAEVSKALGVPQTSGPSDLAEDISLRLNKIFAHDDYGREQIDRAQSEIVRNRLLRDQNSEDQINAAKYKTADNLASLGLNGWADATAHAVVTPEMQTVAQTLLDPQTWIEFGVGKSAGMVKTGVSFSRVENATKNLAKASEIADNLAVQREAFKGVIRAPGATQEERIAAQRTLAAQTPLERDAQAAVTKATQEHQVAITITNQEMTDAAQPGHGRFAVGKLAQGTGALAEMAGKLSDWAATLPEKVIGALAPNMDPVAKGILAQSIRHTMGSAIHGGPFIGGLAGLASPLLSKSLQKYGRDLAMIGEQFALGQQTLPFWKAIKENTTGMTKVAVSLLDNQLVYAIPDTARGAAHGALMGGVVGGIQSGGTEQGVIGGAASGGVFGAAGGGLGQIKKFNSPGELHAAAIGDRARFIRTLNPNDAKFFQGLDPGSQLAMSVYMRTHPDTGINFYSDPGGVNGDHQVIDGKGLIRINVNADNPFHAVLAHEIGHHIAAHGLGDEVNAQILGDPATGRPGVFTKIDENGKPMIDIPDANGIVRYLPNDEFERYKADYNKRLPADHPKAGNYDIAQELFADLHAAKFSDPAQVQKLVRGYVPSGLIGENVISNWLTRTNVPVDPVTGRSVITDAVAKTRGLNKILNNFYRQRQYKSNPVTDDTGHVRVPVEGVRKGTDEFGRLSHTFDATTALRRNPDGTLWTDSAGRPAIVPTREMDAVHGQMTDDIISAIKANPQYETMPGDYVKLVTDRRGRQYYRGQVLQPEAQAKVAASNKYNAVQVLNLTRIGGAMERNDGTMFTQVYNTAGKKGKYATLPAQERAIVPLYFEIDPKTRQTNILSYDPEQMSANITKVLRRGKAKELWDGNIQAMTGDVKTYLDNLSNNRPGATGIGWDKKGVINNLFGLEADANPLIEDVTRKSPSVFKTFRLDRINRLNELSERASLGRETYEQVRAYAQPRRLGFEGVPAEPPPIVQAIPTRPEPFAHLPDEALPKLSDVAHTKHLPAGAHFLDPKGVRRKVPHG